MAATAQRRSPLRGCRLPPAQAARPAEARTLWGFLSAGEGVSPTLVPASHGKFQAARNAPGAERVRDLTR